MHVLVSVTLATLVASGEPSLDRLTPLEHWYQSVGAPAPNEGFGEFLSRVARSRVNTPYGHSRGMASVETLQPELSRFECVSFIESSLAVARCAWRGQTTADCFVWELLGLRYRGGIISDYTSRLHYFVDWLEDNRGRWRMRDITSDLGGVPVRRAFFYLTRRAGFIPALSSPSTWNVMTEIEARLSAETYVVVGRDRIQGAVQDLRDGDIVAVAGTKPGLLITHAGFIILNDQAKPHLVHASSHHGRVVVTRKNLAEYVLRRPERRGVIVARPIAP